MKTNNIAIFPYSNELYSFLGYIQVTQVMTVQYIISLKGYGIIGKEIWVGDKKWTVQEQLSEEQYAKIDTIWITSLAANLATNILFEFIETAAERKLEIFITANLKDEVKEEIKKINQKYSNHVDFLDDTVYEDCKYENNVMVNVPVITVFGVGEMTQKSDIQIYLRNHFGDDFKVCQVGTNRDCKMLGMYSFPAFMSEKRYSEKEKICKFNHWIKELEDENKPDVIILGIPGGIMPLNDKHTFDYGVLAYEIFSAIKPDYSIMTLYAGKYTDRFYEDMKELCKYRYDFELDSFFVSKYSPMSNSMKDDILNFVEISGAVNEKNNYLVYDSKALENSDMYVDICHTLEVYSAFESI